jgi:hypothetical protein
MIKPRSRKKEGGQDSGQIDIVAKYGILSVQDGRPSVIKR